jgi:hypothetical protein
MPKQSLRKVLKYEQHDEFGTLMTLAEFKANCVAGVIVRTDGVGYYATETLVTNIYADPKKFCMDDEFTMFTHVMWYNK